MISASPLKSRLLVACALLMAVWLCPAEAAAQPEATESSAIRAAAKELYDEAREARKTDDFATCHAKASAAWAIHEHLSIAALIGDCAVGIGNFRDGAERLYLYLNADDTKGTAGLRAHLRARYDEARQHVGIVEVTISPEDATCTVDGKALPALPAMVFVDPGEHAFEGKHAGFTIKLETVTLAAGEGINLRLDLVPVPEKLPEVDENGQPIIITKTSNGPGMGYVIGASVAGAVLVGGAVLTIVSGVLHANATSEIDSQNEFIDGAAPGDRACDGGSNAALEGRCADLKDAINDQDTFATLFPVGLVLAGVGAAGVATFLALHFTAPEEDVVVSVSPRGVSLRVGF